jgi:hypothetical protein
MSKKREQCQRMSNLSVSPLLGAKLAKRTLPRDFPYPTFLSHPVPFRCLISGTTISPREVTVVHISAAGEDARLVLWCSLVCPLLADRLTLAASRDLPSFHTVSFRPHPRV